MAEKAYAKLSVDLEEGIEEFIAERRAKVGSFVETHFSLRETLEIQKRTIVADLFSNPINAAWSIPYLFAKKAVESLDKMGWTKLNPYFSAVPSGLRTGYQREVERLVVDEILDRAAFERCLGKRPALRKLIDENPSILASISGEPEFREAIGAYSVSRSTISDLSGSVVTLFAGWLFFGDGNLGVSGIGDRIARRVARKKAASEFFLGEGVGDTFYGLFPPQPTTGQVVFSTFLVYALLLLCSLVVTFLSDPLRKKLGLQERKIHSMLDHLEERLLVQTRRRLKNAIGNI
ncbi:MAG: DUF6635 family protein [Bdellovibrionota bacterium]